MRKTILACLCLMTGILCMANSARAEEKMATETTVAGGVPTAIVVENVPCLVTVEPAGKKKIFFAGTLTQEFLKSFREIFSEGVFGVGPYHLEYEKNITPSIRGGVAIGLQEAWFAVFLEREWRIGLLPNDFFSLGAGLITAPKTGIRRDISLQGEYHHSLSQNVSFFVGDNINFISYKNEKISAKGISHEPFVGMRFLGTKGTPWILDVLYNPEFASLQEEDDKKKESEVGLGALNFTLRRQIK